jgi:CRISPR-associated protein Csm2
LVKTNNNFKSKKEEKKQKANTLKEEILKAIENALDSSKDKEGSLFYDLAKKTGEMLALEDVTTTRIRKVFNEVKVLDRKRVDDKNTLEFELKKLRARMAYLAGRFKEAKNFYEIIDKSIRLVEEKKWTFENFRNFFEAIVAYNRFFAEKEQVILRRLNATWMLF